MSLLKILPDKRLFQVQIINCSRLLKLIPSASYAKKIGFSDGGRSKGKLGGPIIEKKKLDVETDPNRLVSYVCGTNLLKEGGEDIQIKADSEYPDWLWNFNIHGPPKLEDLDPNTVEYWKLLRNRVVKRQMIALKLKKV